MVKSKNIIAGLGVVAGLGVAMLPLGAFAEAPSAETNAHYIRAHVGEIISIAMNSNKAMTDLTDHSRIEITPGGAVDATLIHTVTVNSNARGGYDLLLKADKANLELIDSYWTSADTETQGDEPTKKVGEAKSYNPNIAIKGIEGASDALTDNAGWGYKVAAHATTGTTDFGTGPFLKVPTTYGSSSVVAATKKDGTTYQYHTETAAYTEKYDFNYGVKAASDQPSGSYEAAVTYKAVAHVLGDE